MLKLFIQTISFFQTKLISIRCKTVIGIVPCYSHQACCLLYYLCEVISNNDIHIHLSQCNCTFGFEQKYWWIDGFGGKRHGLADLPTPIHPPLQVSKMNQTFSYTRQDIDISPACDNLLYLTRRSLCNIINSFLV